MNADDLLIDYAEAATILGSAPAQRLIVHIGGHANLFCGMDGCEGTPRRHRDDWKCSVCQRLWPTEKIGLGRRQIGRQRPNRIRSNISRLHERLGEGTVLFRDVHTSAPWPFRAWVVHVLSDGPLYEIGKVNGTVPMLGIALGDVPARLRAHVEAGDILEPLPSSMTVWGVQRWVAIARRLAMRHFHQRRRGIRPMEAHDITVEKIAALLDVDVETVRRWIRSGKLDAFWTGTEYRVSERDLNAFVEARKCSERSAEQDRPTTSHD